MLRKRWWIILLIAILVLTAAGWGIYAWLFVDLPSPDELPKRAAAPSSKIYDRNGQLLFEVIDPHLGKHSPLPLSDIPLALRQATIATEDADFYRNPGVDWRGILRAVWINLRGGEVLSGGSTITQQVARNLLFTPEQRAERSLTRKLRESILAWRIARTFSKDEVLALYLNEIYYGNFAYGIEAAAQSFFSKSVGELDLAECALLAGLPQSPVLYNPLINLDAARRRQRVVLDLMVRQSYITPAEADLAAAETLHFATDPFPIRAPHFVSYVWNSLENRLGTERTAQGGLEVYTTLDVDLQEKAQNIIQRHLSALQERSSLDHNANNAAVLSLDPQTGEILVMVGSADYFDAAISGAVNTCLALRQPGSAIKPITYAVAFDPAWQDRSAEAETRWGRLPFTPATVLMDVRTSFITYEGVGYVPLNYDLRWHGPVSLRVALGASYNLPAVKVLEAVGIEPMIAQARRMGISTFDQTERQLGLALTLGGGEVRMIELAGAFGVFATGGDWIEPTGIQRVLDAQGQTLFTAPGNRQRDVLDRRVAYLITDILSDEWARLPSFGEQSALYIGRPAAAKTGTTTDWRDNWTVGYTPDLLTAVWVGNANNEPMYQVSGITGAGPIWHDLMIWALKGRPAREFVRPEGLVEQEVCALSGLRPNAYCSHRRRELFIADTEPTAVCDWHQLIAIDTVTGLRATAATPPERVRQRVYAVYPAEALAWAIGQDIPQPPPDPQAADPTLPGADEPTLNAPLEIVSPFQMDRYRISSSLPRQDQRIMIEARTGQGTSFAQITLYVDDEPLITLDRPPFRTWWVLQPGEHRIYAVGLQANGASVISEAITLIVVE